ncbi:MAG TPA: hypothetical protein VOA41_00155 [Candidatus Dormibacteraeota bacterium]|nr:hypothetical protein [Candidatus Dormibacteraeota bacterium]
MIRTVSLIVLAGLTATLLVGLSLFQGHQSGIVPKVHAQETDRHESCSNATLKGTYGFYRTGTTGVGPLAAVGLETFDGTGAHSPARQTIRRNGVTVRDLFADPALDGPYEVDPDCAGRFLNFDGSVAGHFVVVDGGKEIFGISLAPGNSVIAVFRRINED